MEVLIGKWSSFINLCTLGTRLLIYVYFGTVTREAIVLYLVAVSLHYSIYLGSVKRCVTIVLSSLKLDILDDFSTASETKLHQSRAAQVRFKRRAKVCMLNLLHKL